MKSMKTIKTIVITGGPCAGKSTLLNTLKERFPNKLLCMPETATELIHGGICPWTCRDQLEFQNHLFALQLKKEEIYRAMAKANDISLIVCDRGLMDNKAYLTPQQFEQLCARFQMNEDRCLQRYDAIIHLQSTAVDAPQFYTTRNNDARNETVEEAVLSDRRCKEAWENHPNFYFVDNSKSWEKKRDSAMEIIIREGKLC